MPLSVTSLLYVSGVAITSEQTAGDALVALDKTEIRRRARSFSTSWRGVSSEASEKQSFWNDFFEIFGTQRRQVAAYEAIARRSSTGRHGWIDLLLPGQMAVEHKSEGQSLDAAMAQMTDYLPSLPPSEHPWLLVVSDFAQFRWHNLETNQSGEFLLDELVDNLDLFWWLAGYRIEHRQYHDEVAANMAATQLLADLHDTLEASGYPTTDLREWITRILFCLFADDTGVWDRMAFHSYLALHSAPDGHDVGDVVARVFRVLSTPPYNRPSSLDDDLAQFTYINGDLFSTDLWPVTGNAEVRKALLAACSFNWSEISPAIFGSLFQNVMTKQERRKLGAHYTSEPNILRTIRPLFLDELEAELAAARSQPKLKSFHEKLANLTFFDPACGCGNFLVIAYREIRRLETKCLRVLREKQKQEGQRVVSLDFLCRVQVDHFYGIEIEEFPARIARTAMYLVDHLENRKVSAEFGEHYVRFPIPASPHIRIGNALRIDWNEALPAEQCSYLFGNPPFAGQKTRAADQTADLKHVWGDDFARWMDYVSGWYRIAADYINGTGVRAAFVSTNSIAQGEQVARIWQPMLEQGITIDFAHRTFAWTSEARGKAHVHVVIIGFSTGGRDHRCVVFDYPTLSSEPESQAVSRLNPYLLDGPDVIVASRTTPLSPYLSPVAYGNKPSDGGFLILNESELPDLSDPAHQYIRPFVGAHDLIHSERRYCIWMEAPDADCVRRSSFLRERLEGVAAYRAASTAADTRNVADRPWRFFRTPQPTVPYIAIPRHVSHTRQWFTVAHEPPEVIASDALFTAIDEDGFVFGLLSSAMFMAWLRTIGGMLKSDLRFSGPIVYNTFPLVQLDAAARQKVAAAGEILKQARLSHSELSLADMYAPLSTPPDVLAAHKALDLAVDRLFTQRGRPATVTDRMKLLFEAYSAANNN